MKIKLYLNKSLEENANIYFDKSKKFKKKIAGAKKALENSKLKLKNIKPKKEEVKSIKRKKEWFEKFRWFKTSEGLLVIGGRDATTNEIVIKKHLDKEDVVFHTDMAGSPFFVIKGQPNKESLEETAQATASYSRGWKLGLTIMDVFYVKPEQVSKEAQSGEYMSKGSFMIRGKTTYLHPKLELAIGMNGDVLMGGPINSIKKWCKDYLIIVQGKEKPSNIAKKISKKFNYSDIDEIIRFLPSGNCNIK